MKKLLMIATALAAVVTQAASVDWKVTYASKGTEWAANGATVMAFAGSSYDDVVKLVTVTGSSSLESALSEYSLGKSKFTNFRGSAMTTPAVQSVTSGDKMFWMIFTEGSYDAGKAVIWTAATDISSAKYDPPASGTTFAMDSSYFANSGTIAKASSIPEPTSAMLLVLGMAGLMLKRKRA